MRIRSIKPEFWASEDVARWDWDTRLIFIGLWSYVDDNGVGRDNERLILASLFPLDRDPLDALARLSGALKTLSDGPWVTRYEMAGKAYLFINAWDEHQRIDKPSKPRYPRPTSIDAESSRGFQESLALGTEEQWNRGAVKEHAPPARKTLAQRRIEAEPAFAEWYAAYPRRKNRPAALDAYLKTDGKIDPDRLLVLTRSFAASAVFKNAKFIPYPATWLNGEMWNDEPDPEQVADPSRRHVNLAAPEHVPPPANDPFQAKEAS